MCSSRITTPSLFCDGKHRADQVVVARGNAIPTSDRVHDESLLAVPASAQDPALSNA